DSLENIDFQLRKQLIEVKREKDLKKEDSLKKELQNFKDTVSKNFPIIANYTQNVFNIDDFQSQLDNRQLVLKYLFFYDQLAVISITKNNIKIELKPWTQSEKNLVNEHLVYLKNPNSNYTLNSELTNLLIPDMVNNYNAIIIIPDAPIYNLPFETLTYNSDFLIKEKTIHYSSHLRFIHGLNLEKKRKDTETTIFAPSYPKEKVDYVTRNYPVFLEGAQKEAERLAVLFPTKSFIGDDATKSNFIENKSEGNILHLAMHATIDETDPSLSHFNFANNEKLFLEEVYALKIPTDLAVLSACNTGIGKQDNALSMATLQRAFNYAGAKTTVASLWEVPDETTSQIMIAFYQYLKKGKTKSKALQQAKLDYLNQVENPRFKQPYYWAGFVLYGADAPVAQSFLDNKTIFLLVFGGITLIFGIWLFFRKK
ncbi:MAG: CHAT domain-containing protein, partial [Bacteroidota bacterium]